jgi:hypothetical protein
MAFNRNWEKGNTIPKSRIFAPRIYDLSLSFGGFFGRLKETIKRINGNWRIFLGRADNELSPDGQHRVEIE